MNTYRRATRVAAPLDEVWAFHSRIEGLEALTPSFMNLRVHGVERPNADESADDESPKVNDSDGSESVLDAGTRVELSIRPFGVGPRQHWETEIVERERDDDAAYFVDEMNGGPFPYWRHAHRFFGVDGETIIVDEVTYALPGGPVGDAVSPLAVVGFEPMFRDRHRRTKQLLE